MKPAEIFLQRVFRHARSGDFLQSAFPCWWRRVQRLPHASRTMPNEMNFRLRDSADFRLRRHADYQRVYKAGRKQFGRQMAYFFALRDADAAARSETEGPRVGLTVPKALGKAVARNRIKRRLREAVRAALPVLSAPVDVVLHPKRSVIDAEFALIEREVETIFQKISEAASQQVSKSVGRR